MNMSLKEVNENIISLLNDLVKHTENNKIEWIFDKHSEICNDNEDHAVFVTKKYYIYDNNTYVLHFTRRLVNNDTIARIDTSVNKTYDQLKVWIYHKGSKNSDYDGYITNAFSTIIDKYTVNEYNGDNIKAKIEELLDSLYKAIYKKLSFDNNRIINKFLADAMYAIINGEVYPNDKN